jgi:DNA-binding NarL/FixJ family response regulator
MNEIRIAIVDDHKIVSDGISATLMPYSHFNITAACTDAESLLEKFPYIKPDIVIVDLQLPGMSGEELIRIIKREHPHVRILVFSAHVDEYSLHAAVNAGADGYLSKDAHSGLLKEALQSLSQGEEYYGGKISSIVYKSYAMNNLASSQQMSKNQLTEREQAVLECFANGMSYKETAEKLFISPRTVETHKNHIMEKLELRTLADLIKYALRNNIISL